MAERWKDPRMRYGVQSQQELLKSTSHYIPEESLSDYHSKNHYNQNLKLLFK